MNDREKLVNDHKIASMGAAIITSIIFLVLGFYMS